MATANPGPAAIQQKLGVLRSDGGRSVRVVLRRIAPAVFSLAGILGCTWISFRLGQSLGSAGFLYLVFVVLAAMYGGFWQATVASVVAVACLDFFFDEPVFSFTVGSLSNWVELGAFEFTAVIISQLSNRANQRAMEAVAERRDTARLYRTARQILLHETTTDPGYSVAALIRESFDLRGVALFDATSGEDYCSGETGDRNAEKGREACFRDEEDYFDPAEKTWYCVLRLGSLPLGAVTLCGAEIGHLTATAIASLAAIALERARSAEREARAEAARQAEQLRTAVLDALAHQFKTPLTVIRTASSGLPAAGELSPLQTELVSLIDQESRKLNDLASRLLGSPTLQAAEFAPQPEPLLLSRLMKSAIRELESEPDRKRFRVEAPPEEAPVFADRELILTALSQLADNALKYSRRRSSIEVAVMVEESVVVLTVLSEGLVVSEAERDRIFDRFYRTPAARDYSSGAGLGLSIVKTIAQDHNGRVWAEGLPGQGTRISLSLPKFTRANSEGQH